jgi:hypothetical protein
MLAVAIGLAVAQGVAGVAQAETTVDSTGYDVSYLDCDASLPAEFGFAVVNVNHGRPFTANQCFASEVAWAGTGQSQTQPVLSFYINTSNPGPDKTTYWPTDASGAPRSCDGTWTAACAYDFGWLSAQDAFGRAVAVVGTPSATSSAWWLDVETANSWSDDQAMNVATLIGSVDALRAEGVAQIGMYATRSHWMEITGATSVASPINAPFRDMPNWIPRLGSLDQATDNCSVSQSLTGGPVVFVQYEFFLDKNYACGR